MPEIKVKHIVSFSSEDKVFKAENLLKAETYRKWKCANPGEKNASIVLQFEKATQIHSIDIGNEHSAFVEVLVTRSSDMKGEYKVLLVASSFMSPLESRNGTNVNRVRMFGPDKLSQNLKDEKWDTVEIVCTQPFNKNVQYGLSFVKFHSPPEPEDAESEEPKLQFGRFEVKEENDESPLARGAWFQKKKVTDSNDDKFSTSPSAIRQAAPSFAASLLASKESKASSPTSYSAMMASIKRKHANDERGNLSQPKKRELTADHLKTNAENTSQNETSNKFVCDVSKEAKVTPHLSQEGKQVSRKPENTVGKKKQQSQIMEKVVFVISGFQNPERGMIRDFALEMGAQYKADWDPSCTHLVCAFANTPKFLQVQKKGGRIVTKKWILDCYKKKELLPWRKYMLGKNAESSSSSEEDEEEEANHNVHVEEKPKKANKTPLKNGNGTEAGISLALNGGSSGNTHSFESRVLPKKNVSPAKVEGPTTLSGDDTSAESDYKADTDVDSSSGGDTEDEIRKVENVSRIRNTNNSPPAKREKSADHKSPVSMKKKPDTTKLPLPELPDFFNKKTFFLYGEFSEKERHDLERYITAYNGSVAQYMGDDVKFVITVSKWNESFDEALLENDNLIFVHPRWIYKCHQNHKLTPYQPHIIVPDE